MSRLPKKHIDRLRSLLYHAQRAQGFILNPKTVLATRTQSMAERSGWANPELSQFEYVREYDGAVIAETHKEIGSDIAGLSFAIEGLQRIINEAEATS